MSDIQDPKSTTETAPLTKYLFAHQPINSKQRHYAKQRRDLLLEENLALQEKLKELEGKVYDQKLARGIHKLLEMAETLSAFIHIPN